MKKIIAVLLLVGLVWSGFSQPYDREWATYFGDSSLWISGIAELDENLFIVGKTTNSTYTESMATPSAFQPQYGGGESDGFMAKISEDGQLVWFTYYGGPGNDEITDIIIHENRIYLVGKTSSTGLATEGVHQTSLNGIADGFLASFDLDGNRTWHTYLGGEGEDEVISLTADSGKLIVHGRTSSHTSIATPNAFQETIHSDGLTGAYANNFITAFSLNGTRLWGTYYGLTTINNSFDSHKQLTGIAANKIGFYVSGFDVDRDNNTYYGTPGAFMETRPGPVPMSLYLSKFDNEGNRLWSTYYNPVNAQGNSTSTMPYGGAGYTKTYQVLTATDDGVYMSGRTIGSSAGTEGSFQPSKTGAWVPFLMNFSNTGERLWGSYLGNGYGTDTGGGFTGTHLSGLSKDSENNIYMAGATHSVGDIATPDGFQLEKGDYCSLFMAKISPDGTTKKYGTYYGGEQCDSDGKLVSIGSGDSFYLVGTTASTSGMTTPGAWQEDFVFGGEYEKNIIIIKFSDPETIGIPNLSKAPLQLYPNPVKDKLYLQTSDKTEFEITIFNTTGRLLHKASITSAVPLDLSMLSSGIYIAEIKDKNNITVQKMKLIKL